VSQEGVSNSLVYPAYHATPLCASSRLSLVLTWRHKFLDFNKYKKLQSPRYVGPTWRRVPRGHVAVGYGGTACGTGGTHVAVGRERGLRHVGPTMPLSGGTLLAT
jgi:hypothetical protein